MRTSPGPRALAACLSGFLAGCNPVAPPGNYDLTSLRLSWSPAQVKVGDPVVFSYTVDNLGTSTVPARTYDVELHVDGSIVSYDRATAELPPGERTEYSMGPGFWHWKPERPGNYRYELRLDPHRRLEEADETNNTISGTITVVDNQRSLRAMTSTAVPSARSTPGASR